MIDMNSRSISIDCENGWLKVTPYTPDIIRVQWSPAGPPEDSEGYAVAAREWDEVKRDVVDTQDTTTIKTDLISVSVTRSSCAIEFRTNEDELLTISRLRKTGHYTGSVNASDPNEHFFGFGLQFHSLDQRGKLRVIKTNADPPVDNGMAHAPDPFFYSSRGYAIFLNSHAYSHFDMCRSRDDEYTFNTPEDSLDYFLIYGPSFRRISELQTLLRGRMSMPAKWGLGFWYRMPVTWKADQTVEVAQEFRKRSVPCDVIGLEPTWQTHTYPCTYVWNEEYYPDPAGYVNWMRQNGFHLNLWEHAWVHKDSPIYGQLKDSGLLADKTAMGGAVPDFTFKKTSEIYTDLHKSRHIDLGVDGYKLDECDGSDFSGDWFYPDDTTFPSGMTGDQMHNLTGFLYQKAFHEMFNQLGLRTYLLLRASFAGGQAYPSVIYSDYYRLPQYIRAQATGGFSGFLWCPELRGAASTDDFLRRAQNMFFSPLAMINAWNGDETLLPWMRGEEAEDVFRKYAQLRMRLIPYLYSCFRKTQQTGLPVVRALVMDYPDDPQTYSIDDQFMFGEYMMVAPLAEGTSRTIYLPDGEWFDFWTDKIYTGGQSITFNAPADIIPIFVKSGAIIPMAPWMNHVEEKPVEELELHIYPGEAEFVFYDDDGFTTSYLEGDCVEVPMKLTPDKLVIGKPEGSYTCPIQSFKIKLHTAGSFQEVKLPFGQSHDISL